MAQKIIVQDGNIAYTTSDPSTHLVNFDIGGQLNVASNLNVGNDPMSPGIITTSSGQSLTITTGAGGNLSLSPSGALLLNGATWPIGSLSVNPGQYLGASGLNTLAFYSFIFAFNGSDTLTISQLNTLYPSIQPGQSVIGPTVSYLCVSSGQWRISSPALGYTPVNVAGDTMLGYLILNADPTTNLGAVTKQYVDRISTGININGAVDTSTTISSNLTSNSYTPGIAGPAPDTGTGVGGYLSSLSNVVLGTIGGDPNLVVGSRILVQNQTIQTQNGVYVVTDLGSISTPWVLTRASDYNNSTPGQVHAGNVIFVQNGTLAGTQWAEIQNGTGANDTIIIDTDNIIFTQFAGPGTFTGGPGINVSSNTISNTGVLSNLAGTGINVSSSTGFVTITNAGVTSIIAGPGINVSNPSGNVTLSVNGLSSSIITPVGPINVSEMYISNNSFIVPTTNAGDIYRITIYGTCTSTATNTNTFNLRFGPGGNLSDTAFYTTAIASSNVGTNTPFKLEFICTVTNSSTILFQTSGSFINVGATGFDSSSSGISINSCGVFQSAISSALTPGTNILGVSYLSSNSTTNCSFQNVIIEAVR